MTGAEALALLPDAVDRLLADVYDLLEVDGPEHPDRWQLADVKARALGAARRLLITADAVAPLVAIAGHQVADQARLRIADQDAALSERGRGRSQRHEARRREQAEPAERDEPAVKGWKRAPRAPRVLEPEREPTNYATRHDSFVSSGRRRHTRPTTSPSHHALEGTR